MTPQQMIIHSNLTPHTACKGESSPNLGTLPKFDTHTYISSNTMVGFTEIQGFELFMPHGSGLTYFPVWTNDVSLAAYLPLAD